MKKAILEGEKLGAAAERAAVVKYLRRMATETSVKYVAIEWQIAADAVEKGEHHK